MATGWDIESETATPPATSGWDVVSTLPAFKPHGRSGGGGPAGVRPMTTDETVGDLTGPRGLPSSFDDQRPVGEQILGTADTALAGITGFGKMIAHGAANFGPDALRAVTTARNRIAGLPDDADSIPMDNKPINDAIDALPYSPHTDTGKEVFSGMASGAKAASDAIDTVPGVKDFRASAAPIVKPIGDALAMAPGAGKVIDAVNGVQAIRAGNAAATAERAAARAGNLPPSPDDLKAVTDAGFKISPSNQKHANQAGAGGEPPGHLALTAEAATGAQSVGADNIAYNRDVVHHWAAVDMGLPADAPITAVNIEAAKEKLAPAFQRVADIGTEPKPVSEATAAALDATTAKDTLGRAMPGEHSNTVELLKSEPMSNQDLMDKISALRTEGYKRNTPTVPGGQVDPAAEAYGDAQIAAAKALEKELGDRVAATGNPRLMADYLAAKKIRAKIGVVEAATTGNVVDPAKISRLGAKSGILDGGLGLIKKAFDLAPGDVAHKIPKVAALEGALGPAAAGGAAGAVIAGATGHPGLMALAAGVPVARFAIRKGLQATRGQALVSELPATAAEAAQHPTLGSHFHGRDAPPEKPFELTPPTAGNVPDTHGLYREPPEVPLNPVLRSPEPPPPQTGTRSFTPHQPSIFRSGENVPVAEQGGLPPGLTLETPSPNTRAHKVHQPSLLRSGENVPVAEQGGLPPGLTLAPPDGQAFHAHPPSPGEPGVAAEPNVLAAPEATGEPLGPSPPDTSSRPKGGPRTAPQYTLSLGDAVAGGNSVVLHHGTPGAAFDKFDNTKSRSGSGANARGTGTYFSDKEGEPRTFAGDKGGHVVHSTVSTDTIDRMLDLDKPLKDQPRVVAALKDVPGVNLNMTGEQLRAKIAETEKLGKTSDEPMAKWLESRGIPGVKYAATKAGKPTGANNYILHNAGRDAAVTGSTRVKGGLGDVVAERTKVGGGLSADDLKLAE